MDKLRTETENLAIYRKAIETFGKTNQIDMAIEEMAELIKELNKWKRGFNNNQETMLEIADVFIMMYQLVLIFDKNEDKQVLKYIDSQTRRLEGLMK